MIRTIVLLWLLDALAFEDIVEVHTCSLGECQTFFKDSDSGIWGYLPDLGPSVIGRRRDRHLLETNGHQVGASIMPETRLKVLTFNCWGLKYVSKYRMERIIAIANALASSDYDVVTLQELWVFADYELVRVTVSERLPYSKFFHSGALGAGLVILTRFPILAATIHPYSLNGSPIDVVAGDWFVGKAAASIVFAHPILGQVEVYNTHFFAKGGDEGPEHQRAHRLVNAWEFAKLVRQSAEVGRYIIASGDFNSSPSTLPMDIIRDHAGLTDAWAVTHLDTPEPNLHNPPSPQDAIHLYGVTADSPLNSYSAGKPLEHRARKFQGKRLDYVLYRQPSSIHATARIPILRAVDTRVVMTELVPGYHFSYSDHFGVEATFDIEAPGGGHATEPTSVDIPTSNHPKPALSQTDISTDSITEALVSLTARYRFAESQAREHLMTFVLCVLALIAIISTSPWFPSYVDPALTLATVAVAWYATTMLYVGFVYGNWEVNPLTNIIEELELYRAALEAGQLGRLRPQ